MKKLIALFLLSFSLGVLADKSVSGYTRKDGTYVAPYYRSSPDTHLYNNYSSERTNNPYTGERGYKHNEFSGSASL